MIEINKNPSKRELRQFGLLLILFSGVVGCLEWYRSGSTEISWYIWLIGPSAAVVGFVAIPFMRLLYLGLCYIAFPIGWTISHLLLALIYFVILTPIALLMRGTGRDPLEKRPERGKATYWERLPEVEDPAEYFRQF